MGSSFFELKKNLSQKRLAELVGVTRQTIGLIEKGQYNPTLHLCLQICYQLGKTLDQVFWIEQSEVRNVEKSY
ncbi:helix-turn-helix transcriptional regulator [Liquorilactobacillus vini]|uniref:helix-turn-helix transcriptional regulator n=1 Tax=Liquorilactobacillus vini TaxID=238015 RepID=UPI000C1FC034|nr:helix-turn-helix transcriptional regulator [Liquorilactobacillus vini]